MTTNIPKSSVDSNGSETHYSPSAIDAETLYRKVRPGHFTVPRSEKFGSAMEILIKYLENYKGDFDAAADALRPFAEEADRRNISQLNLCWLTEWAAAGVMPTHSKKNEFRTFSTQGFRQSLKKVNATPWVQERLFRLLDIRYTLALREQALTFMAANYESTAQFPVYLRSRMEDVHFSPSVFILEGMDMRKVLRSKLCLTQIG